MSKEAWFREYEKLYDKRENGEIEGTDTELADRAYAALTDSQASLVDREVDWLWDEYSCWCQCPSRISTATIEHSCKTCGKRSSND